MAATTLTTPNWRPVKGAAVGEPTFVAEYAELKRFWGVTPYIETTLGEPFRLLVG